MKTMERCSNNIRRWILTDKLKLKEKLFLKNKFVVIGTQNQLGKVYIGELSVGDSKIIPVSTARIFGFG